MAVDEERYGIAELAEAADVSVRTVRYYIAEGLLPPPVTAGARSYYTREHLARLQLIGRLKDAYLPLREIRRHLAALNDETIIELAEETEAAADADPSKIEVGPIDIDFSGLNEMISSKIRESFPPGFPFHNVRQQREQAKEQRTREREAGRTQRQHERQQQQQERERERAERQAEQLRDRKEWEVEQRRDREERDAERSQAMGAPASESVRSPEEERRSSADTATEYIARVLQSTRHQQRPPAAPSPPRPPQSPPERPSGETGTETLWRHIRISDDAQLLIREEAFGRRLEKIEWLIGWAKKVLG
jgi:DNA-binding transcriptional MerR regulator